MMTMNPVGALAGAILVIDGANAISKEINRTLQHQPNSEGMLADGVMDIAQFMGFKRESALGVFNSVSPQQASIRYLAPSGNPNHGVCFAISRWISTARSTE